MLSGTSMDGVDIGLFDFSNGFKLIAGKTYPYPDTLYQNLVKLVAKDDIHDPLVPELDQQLGQLYADYILQFINEHELKTKEIIAIGSHGQNISHHPNAKPAYTCQIGAGNVIAKKTGITTVTNFRIADVAAGGQGAPLAPLLHREIFSPHTPCAVINIGGIANVSFITDKQVTGFDTGPGNALMDAWINKHQQKTYDNNGGWAATGCVDEQLLQTLLTDDYFQKTGPKSTGKEYFNLTWLETFLEEQQPVNVQATLLELTAQTIANSIKNHAEISTVYICGGGVHNAQLLRRLKTLIKVNVDSTAALNIDPNFLEAMLFAWLAHQRLAEKKLSTQNITGAQHAVMLGEIFN